MNIISYAIGLNSSGGGSGGGDAPTAEELTLTNNCAYRFANGIWDWVIRLYGNSITTNNITNAEGMFKQSKVSNIPFEIQASSSANTFSMEQMFLSAPLTIPPTIKNANPSNLISLFSYEQYQRITLTLGVGIISKHFLHHMEVITTEYLEIVIHYVLSQQN